MSGGFALRPLDGGRIGVDDGAGRVRAGLSSLFQRLATTSPHYRELLAEAATDDPFLMLAALPATEKPTYRGVLARECLAAMGASSFISDHSSGTTAQPVARYSRPVDELAEQSLTEPVFAAAGIGPGSRLLCIDVNAAEIADFYARTARALGAGCTAFLHLSADLDAAAAAVRRFDPTHLITIPSLLARLWSASPAAPGALQAIISVGELLTPELRAAVTGSWGCRIFSFYGTTETGGVGAECRHHSGHHLDPAAFVPLLEHATLVEPGLAQGELLLTTTRHRTHAVVNYRVGDIVRLDVRPCRCGDPRPRLIPLRRASDALVFAGYKFSYETLLGALTAGVPGVLGAVFAVHDGDPGRALVTLRLHTVTSGPVAAATCVQALRSGLPDLDAMAGSGVLAIEVATGLPEASHRKSDRILDLRRYAAGRPAPS